MSTLGRFAKKYSKDQNGQFAILFALLAVPMIIAVAYVSDMTYAGKVKAELKASLDSAALAAVIDQTLTEAERTTFAIDHFNENFELSDMFKLDVTDPSAKRVELTATGSFPSYIGAMTGNDKFELEASAASVLTSKDVICMLALDPSSEGAFTVERGASFYGKECSVQVNSTHTRAAIVDSHSSAIAKSFCVSGGSQGTYTPYINSECARIEDPFVKVQAPLSAGCSNLAALSTSNLATAIEETPKFLSISDNAVLSPGVYCKTVSFEGTNITLLPGNYIFEETASFFKGTEVSGDGVTLILNGPTSIIELMGGADLKIKAPATGPYAGIAIFQNRHTAASGKGKNTFSAISEIWNGSGMNITGTVYLPTQRIYIGKDSATDVSSKYVTVSPATSFIAHQIHLDNSVTSVAVDHKSAGLPPMLPRSDEGARLVK